MGRGALRLRSYVYQKHEADNWEGGGGVVRKKKIFLPILHGRINVYQDVAEM